LNTARLQILNIVQGLLARRATAASIETSEDLREAGLTSLDMVNLMLAVEDEFNIEIPQRAMTPENFRSVSAIESLVNAAGAPV
jgi:acyl carrier protein